MQLRYAKVFETMLQCKVQDLPTVLVIIDLIKTALSWIH